MRSSFGPNTGALTLAGASPSQILGAASGIVPTPTIRELLIYSAPGVSLANYTASVAIQFPTIGGGSPSQASHAITNLASASTVNSHLDTGSLSVYTIDPRTKRPVPVGGSSVDLASFVVSAPVDANGIYFVASALETSLSAAYAYPVPFKPSSGHTTIKFLVPGVNSTIKVYTILGELVKEIDTAPDANNIVTWDVHNQDGDAVASGVYIYQIKNSFSEKRGKLIIVR